MSEREREEADFGGPDEVGQMLGELKDVDPPADLVRAVMSEVSSLAPARAGRVQPDLLSGGRVMAKKVLWSVMGAAAAVLIVLKMAGYPPASDATEGTIGAAQRYQAPQISDADVKVKDAELQKLLQSDAFHKLVSDKAARQALANKDVQKALADPNVRFALADEQLRYQLTSDAVRQALSSEQARSALASEQIRLALANAQLRQALANEQIRQALTSEALIGLLATPNFAEMLVADGVQAALLAEGAAAGALAH